MDSDQIFIRVMQLACPVRGRGRASLSPNPHEVASAQIVSVYG